METPKKFFSKKFEFWFLTKSWNHLSFVNISPTLVIDASMEWSSRVLHHGNPKMRIFFKKLEIDEIEFCPYPEFPYSEKRNRPFFVNISPTLVIDTSTERSSWVLQHGNPKMWNIFKKFEIDEIEFCPYPEFPYAQKQYQSYISNWYVNGKVFEYYNMGTKNLIFFQESSKLNLTCAEELKSTFK